MISSPLRSRFGLNNRLDYYGTEDLQSIVERSARILNVDVDKDGACEIARRSRGTPRIVNNLLKRVRDYAQVKANNKITKIIADKALAMLDIDQFGLDEMDKRILNTIMHKFSGGPVGVNSLAVAVAEESDTLEEVYEPYLIQEGYLSRTAKGRTVTDLCYERFGLSRKNPLSKEPELLL